MYTYTSCIALQEQTNRQIDVFVRSWLLIYFNKCCFCLFCVLFTTRRYMCMYSIHVYIYMAIYRQVHYSTCILLYPLAFLRFKTGSTYTCTCIRILLYFAMKFKGVGTWKERKIRVHVYHKTIYMYM